MKPASRNCRTTLKEEALPLKLYLCQTCHMKMEKDKKNKQKNSRHVVLMYRKKNLHRPVCRMTHCCPPLESPWPELGTTTAAWVTQKGGDDGLVDNCVTGLPKFFKTCEMSLLTICLQSFQPIWRSFSPVIPALLCGSSLACAAVRLGWDEEQEKANQ